MQAGTRAFLASVAEHPEFAQTLLVEIIGAGPEAAAAARRDDAGLRRPARRRERRGRRAAGLIARVRLAARRVRDRRRDQRARLAPGPARRARRRARARAGDRPADQRVAGAARRRERSCAGRARGARSSTAGAARGWSRGARRWRGSSAPRSPTRTTGAGRCPGSATRRRRVVVLGLAPAAHGGNRTGRIFTGDRSGDWLFARSVPRRVRQPAAVGLPRRRPDA